MNNEKILSIEEMTYPDFMVTSNAENKVTLTFFNSGSPTASLFMNNAGTAFLIEELAFQIKGDYLIEITKLRG